MLKLSVSIFLKTEAFEHGHMELETLELWNFETLEL